MAHWPIQIAGQAYCIFADIILYVQPLLLRTNECLPSILYIQRVTITTATHTTNTMPKYICWVRWWKFCDYILCI